MTAKFLVCFLLFTTLALSSAIIVPFRSEEPLPRPDFTTYEYYELRNAVLPMYVDIPNDPISRVDFCADYQAEHVANTLIPHSDTEVLLVEGQFLTGGSSSIATAHRRSGLKMWMEDGRLKFDGIVFPQYHAHEFGHSTVYKSKNYHIGGFYAPYCEVEEGNRHHAVYKASVRPRGNESYKWKVMDNLNPAIYPHAVADIDFDTLEFDYGENLMYLNGTSEKNKAATSLDGRYMFVYELNFAWLYDLENNTMQQMYLRNYSPPIMSSSCGSLVYYNDLHKAFEVIAGGDNTMYRYPVEDITKVTKHTVKSIPRIQYGVQYSTKNFFSWLRTPTLLSIYTVSPGQFGGGYFTYVEYDIENYEVTHYVVYKLWPNPDGWFPTAENAPFFDEETGIIHDENWSGYQQGPAMMDGQFVKDKVNGKIYFIGVNQSHGKYCKNSFIHTFEVGAYKSKPSEPGKPDVPEVNPGKPDSDSSALSGGAVAGIVVGTLVAAAAVAGGVIWFVRPSWLQVSGIKERFFGAKVDQSASVTI